MVCEDKMDDPSSETLIADVRIRGVWQSQVDALFDVRIVDTDAPSYQSRSPQAVLRTAEVEKKGEVWCCLSGASCQFHASVLFCRWFIWLRG